MSKEIIVVDSSVWISFFRPSLRNENQKIVQTLNDLLDQDKVALAIPILIELLSGTNKQDLPRIKKLLKALPCFSTTELTWARIESWAGNSATHSQRFGFADLLIAGICIEHGAKIWSLDPDFKRLESVFGLSLLWDH